MKRWATRLAAIGCLGLLVMPPVAAAEPSPAEASLVEAYQRILYEHYEMIDEDQLVQAAIQGMIDSLDDPWASSMTPAEYERFVDQLNADYAGVGVLLNEVDGTLVVSQVYTGAPAAKAGLQAGDRILAVNGRAITSANAATAPSQIIGPAGTTVTLLIQRGSAEPVLYRIQREKINLPSVEGKDLGGGLGYITIHSMGEATTAEFKQVLAELHQPKGIVLDLRENGGGMVLSAVEIADHLLTQGTILSIENGAGERLAIEADGTADPVPMVVLVNENTASAAEILAGALQGNGRAVVVGTRTFGKGEMQQSFRLANGGVLKFTTEHWLLPDGSSLSRVGLQPNRVVTTEGLQVQAAVHLLDPKRPIETPIPTVQLNHVTYLPLRFSLEALAVQVDWSPFDGLIRASYGKQSLVADPVTGQLSIHGVPVSGPAPIQMHEGRAYISASAFTQLTGLELEVRDAGAFLRLK